MWVRLIFENSTVCLISRRISLFCPVDMVACWSFVGWWVMVLMVSLTMILTTCQFRRSGDVALIDCLTCSSERVGYFSMESLILAQDERWRRA
jgi:hypothetical protein